MEVSLKNIKIKSKMPLITSNIKIRLPTDDKIEVKAEKNFIRLHKNRENKTESTCGIAFQSQNVNRSMAKIKYSRSGRFRQ
jgi:hypothetical protein